MDAELIRRFNLEKSIDTEMRLITKIISSGQTDDEKIEAIRMILDNLAEEVVEARAENLYEERTGFLGSKFGEEFLAREIEICRRYGKNFTVGLIDIDGLKHINDKFGHVAGTEVILGLAEAIKAGTRKSDIVSRYGGDEFLIIFTDTSYHKAELSMRRIQKEVDKKNVGSKVKISFSSGLADFDCKDKANSAQLISEADKKLYEAKRVHHGRKA
jgi:two-component system, cell cycle response regulator